MIYHNRRHSSGSLMPNIFFLLQLMGIALLVNMTVQVISLSTMLVYGLAAIVFIAVVYCIDKRSTVLSRQDHFYDAKF